MGAGGRKPINEVGALQTRDALWAQIRQMKSFSILQLRRETRCTLSQTREYVLGLVAAGILERSECERGRYLLVNDCGIEPPRVRRDGAVVTQGLGREQMWRTMRLLKEFTALDLAVQASTEEAGVKLGTAKEYCKALERAGYLGIVRAGKGFGNGGELTRYRFIPGRYSGPLPPMIQRDKSVYDANLKKVVWSKEGGAA